MIPILPECLPRRGNAFSRIASRALLAAWGWRIEGEFPPQPKMVAIVAPHTSNWDFIVGILAVFALGLRPRFLAKHSLFNPWLGPLMRWFGGTPVIRDAPQGAVAQAVALIESEPAVFLAITPAGTRSLAGMSVAVVDDVMTTGATLDEIASTLKASGAHRVVNWVVARTSPPN